MSPKYYPAFINLKGKKCVVVGGGKVAERKIASLLRAGASVEVISPALTVVLEKKRVKGEIAHVKRRYKSSDLKNAFLVIAATSDKEINKKISQDAPCLVNVVDTPELASFIVPAVVQRGHLSIAITTSGASPAIAKAIRKELELLYGKDVGQFLSFLEKIRKKTAREISNKQIRSRILTEAASDDVLAKLRAMGYKAAKDEVLGRQSMIKRRLDKV
ncbi:MAG: bifunctional precorrin-2 dehydrogenase/sirohydrochlorin ferrochelatase [Dissulfurispiraceae bacterium]